MEGGSRGFQPPDVGLSCNPTDQEARQTEISHAPRWMPGGATRRLVMPRCILDRRRTMSTFSGSLFDCHAVLLLLGRLHLQQFRSTSCDDGNGRLECRIVLVVFVLVAVVVLPLVR